MYDSGGSRRGPKGQTTPTTHNVNLPESGSILLKELPTFQPQALQILWAENEFYEIIEYTMYQ